MSENELVEIIVKHGVGDGSVDAPPACVSNKRKRKRSARPAFREKGGNCLIAVVSSPSCGRWGAYSGDLPISDKDLASWCNVRIREEDGLDTVVDDLRNADPTLVVFVVVCAYEFLDLSSSPSTCTTDVELELFKTLQKILKRSRDSRVKTIGFYDCPVQAVALLQTPVSLTSDEVLKAASHIAGPAIARLADHSLLDTQCLLFNSLVEPASQSTSLSFPALQEIWARQFNLSTFSKIPLVIKYCRTVAALLVRGYWPFDLQSVVTRDQKRAPICLSGPSRNEESAYLRSLQKEIQRSEAPQAAAKEPLFVYNKQLPSRILSGSSSCLVASFVASINLPA